MTYILSTNCQKKKNRQSRGSCTIGLRRPEVPKVSLWSTIRLVPRERTLLNEGRTSKVLRETESCRHHTKSYLENLK